MFRSKIISIEKIGELIADDAVITVSSSSGLGCPDASLRSIGKYFLEKGKPRGITAIHPIAAGDMYGIPEMGDVIHPGNAVHVARRDRMDSCNSARFAFLKKVFSN